MKIILFFASMLGVTSAFASFDHYKVTDIGLPAGDNPNVLWLQASRFANNGAASASIVTDSQYEWYLYSTSSFHKLSPQMGSLTGRVYPTEVDWVGYGDVRPNLDPVARAGYYRNNTYHEIAPDLGWSQVSARGATESKYIFGMEATGATTTDQIQPMLYNVDSGEKTILPQLEQSTYISAALDNGVCAVGSTFNQAFSNTLPYLWKDGHYTMLGGSQWIPTALSRTEIAAGTDGGTGRHIFMWKNGTLGVQTLVGFFSVTGISDKGDVSTYSADRNAAILVNMQGIAKIDDLVVNKPSNMTIYGASINFDGHMFGQAKVGNEHHFVLLDPVPEPATWLVVGLGAITLIRRKRRILRFGDQNVTIASIRRQRLATRGCQRTNLVACLMKCAKRRF